MRRALFFTLLLSVAIASHVQADEVYKWVDKNGTVHYGEFPPNNKKSTSIEIPSTPQAAEAEPDEEGSAAATTSAPPAAGGSSDKFLENRRKAKEEKEKEEQRKKEMQRACNEAQSNVKMLQEPGRIRIVDADGNAKFLTDDEIKKRLEVEKKNVAKYCKK